MKIVAISVENIDDSDLEGEYLFEFQFHKCPKVVLRQSDEIARVPYAAGGALSVPLTINLSKNDKMCGSATVRIRPTKKQMKTECHLKKSSGDEVDCKFTVVYCILPCSDVDTLKYTLSSLTLCFSCVFVDTLPEDISIRILEKDTGSCIAMTDLTNIKPRGLLILQSSVAELELSVAGKLLGVVTAPLQLNSSFTLRIDMKHKGYVLLTVQSAAVPDEKISSVNHVLCSGNSSGNTIAYLEEIDDITPEIDTIRRAYSNVFAASAVSKMQSHQGVYLIPCAEPQTTAAADELASACVVKVDNTKKPLLRVVLLRLSGDDAGSGSPIAVVVGTGTVSVASCEELSQQQLTIMMRGELHRPPNDAMSKPDEGKESIIPISVSLSVYSSKPFVVSRPPTPVLASMSVMEALPPNTDAPILPTHYNKASSSSAVSRGGDHAGVVEILNREMIEKQRLIDRLLDDNKYKDQLIADYAAEVTKCQTDNTAVKSELSDYKAAASQQATQHEANLQLLADYYHYPHSLHHVDRATLLSLLSTTTTELKQQKQQNADNQHYMDIATKMTAEFEHLKSRYKELEEARYAQAKQVQKMQKVQEKLDVYTATIGMQEKVIAKLQKIVENHLKNSKRNSTDEVAEDTLSHFPSKRLADTNQLSVLQSKLSSLEAQVAAKDARISSLEEQLVSSSVEASREIAMLRTTIFEMEMGAATERGDSREAEEVQESLADHRSKSKMLIPYDRGTSRESRTSTVASEPVVTGRLTMRSAGAHDSARVSARDVSRQQASPGHITGRSSFFDSISPVSSSKLSPAFSSNRSSPIIFTANDSPAAAKIIPSDMRLSLETLQSDPPSNGINKERSASAKERTVNDRQRNSISRGRRIESLVVPIDSSRSDKDVRYPTI